MTFLSSAGEEMLWAYLDDSAVRFRGNNGTPDRFALGGGIARASIWQELRELWQHRMLHPGNPSQVEWFHYKEWKRAHMGYAKEGQSFYGWSQSQLEQLLADLTEIISERQIEYICASIRAVESEHVVKDSYAAVTKYVLDRAQLIVDRVSKTDSISFVFSAHPEFPDVRIQNYFGQLKKNHWRTDECNVANPRAEIALQAADLIVNEMATSRFIRASFGPEFLMPFDSRMMRLLRKEPPFHLMIEYHKDDNLRP